MSQIIIPNDLPGVLEALGIEIHRIDGDDITAMCPMHEQRTGRPDGHPSWHISISQGLHHCFAGETRVITWDGVFAIRDLVGKRPMLLTSSGWVKAPIRSFGQQPVWEVVLTRNGVKKVVRATEEHRWFVDVSKRGGGLQTIERLTKDLLPGNKLTVARVSKMRRTTNPSPWGIAHGVVFGDGTLTVKDGCKVVLWGDKDHALLKFFPLSPTRAVVTPQGFPGIEVRALPASWKRRPDLSESVSYLYGWLAGLFAADGHVTSSGLPMLASSDRHLLEWVRMLCDRLGLLTYGIKTQMRLGYGSEPSEMCCLTLARGSLRPEFFLVEQHRENFLQGRNTYERKAWRVQSVHPLDEQEEVFCAQVPGSHDFALEDHILTGNCFSCDYAGHIVGLVADVMGTDFLRARRWLRRAGINLDLAEELPGFFERPKWVPKQRPTPPALEGFTEPPQSALDKRRITPEAAKHYGILWSAEERGWVFPIWDPGGDLLGYQFKRKHLVRNRPKAMEKSVTLFGIDVFRGGRAILVESPLDCAVLYSVGITGAVSSFGASVSDTQMRLLLERADEVVLALDNDYAGRTEMRRLVTGVRWRGGDQDKQRPESCTKWASRIPMYVWEYGDTESKDPGDIIKHEDGRAEVYRGLRQAKHSSELGWAPRSRKSTTPTKVTGKRASPVIRLTRGSGSRLTRFGRRR